MAPCSICHDLLPLQNSHDNTFKIKISLHTLMYSAQNDCPSCSMILDGFSSFINTKDSENHEIHILGCLVPPSLFVAVYGLIGLFFESLKGVQCPWKAIGTRTAPVYLTADDYARFIETRYQECITSHEYCSISRPSDKIKLNPYLPTRLLRIVDPDPTMKDAPLKVSLYESSRNLLPEPNTKSYIALSHCWGTAQIITTTKATYHDRLANIPWSSLSHTFQDAITMTRKLGVSYIWIDSLCIIQDSASDWAQEAGNMASVYQNAYLTLAANCSSTSGFLETLRVHTITGTFSESNKGKYTIYVRKGSNHSLFRIAGGAAGGGNQLPLLHRAWTFQEQLLSPRFVHFTDVELVWDCKEGLFCECGGSVDFGFAVKKTMGHLMEIQDRKEMRTAWKDLLEHYTQRNITYDRDRLPALSGLAKAFEGKTMGRYLAGHWENDLPFSLLWIAKYGPGRRSVRSEEALVSNPPSWSWASVECKQLNWIWWRFDMQSEVDIIAAECYPSTSDPRGLVSGGYITMRGKVVSMKVVWPDDATKKMQCRIQHQGKDVGPGNCPWEEVPLASEKAFIASGDIVYFILLVKTIASSKTTHHGLFLRRCTDKEIELSNGIKSVDGIFYKRIGANSLGFEENINYCEDMTLTII